MPGANGDLIYRDSWPAQPPAPSLRVQRCPLRPRLTERRNPRTATIDTATSLEIVDLMRRRTPPSPRRWPRPRAESPAPSTLIEAAFRAGGRLFYVGAGTSGRLGVLDASECPPTFGTPPEMVSGIIAGGAPGAGQVRRGSGGRPRRRHRRRWTSARVGAARRRGRHRRQRDHAVRPRRAGAGPGARRPHGVPHLHRAAAAARATPATSCIAVLVGPRGGDRLHPA